MDGEKEISFSVKVPAEIGERVRAAARAQDRSASSWFRLAALARLAEEERGEEEREVVRVG